MSKSSLIRIAASDGRAWDHLLDMAGGGDQFHRAGYVQALATERGDAAEAVFFESSAGYVFYPYIATHAMSAADGIDIESPYGYSPPVFSSNSALLREDFDRAFQNYCAERRIVTEFVRSNPFLGERRPPSSAQVERVHNPIWVVDLRNPIESIFRAVRKNHRYSIKRATSLGVTVERKTIASRILEFAAMYTATMVRNEASDYYLFSDQFFARIGDVFHDSLDLWVARYRSLEVAYVLVLRNGPWAHYFLSAVTQEGRESNATHLLLWTAISELHRQGCAHFNLGGVPNGDEPLAAFKRGFAAESMPFYTERVVRSDETFDRRCREAGERRSLSGYFPPYKQPASRRSIQARHHGTPLVIYGAGAHGAVVADIVENSAGDDSLEIHAFVDDKEVEPGRRAAGVTVLPGDQVETIGRDKLFIVAIGENRRRRRVFDRLRQHGLEFTNALHRTATVATSAWLGNGIAVAAGVIVNPGARIGDNVILNTGCTIDHHCAVGAHSHIAPGAHLGGEVRVGEGVLVGIGAVVLPGREIGSWAVVGAGAVVTRDVLPGEIVTGVPACAHVKSPSVPRPVSGISG